LGGGVFYLIAKCQIDLVMSIIIVVLSL